MVDKNGDTYLVPEEQVARGQAKGWSVEGDNQALSRLKSEARVEKFDGVGNTIDAYGAAAWRGASGGLSDVVAVGIGGEETREHLAGLREAKPIADLAGSVVGSFTGAGAGAAKIGAALAKKAAGATLASKVGA